MTMQAELTWMLGLHTRLGLLACRRLPIPVLTGPDVEQSR